MRLRSFVHVSALVAVSFVVAACGDEAPPPKAPPPTMASAESAPPPVPTLKDVIDTANGAGKFTTFVKAVQVAGLTDTLRSAGPYTVFAPTDDAFAKVSKDQLDALLADKEQLARTLTKHVVPGKMLASDIAKTPSAKTVNGDELTFAADGDKIKVNGILVSAPDLQAANGVIQGIDTVMMPEPKEPPKPDLLQVASDAKTFTTLTDLIAKAGLTDALKGPGPFTIFAPTDDAFKKVPKKTLEDLAKNTDKLKAVLSYHVVSGKVSSADVAKMTTATTLNGQTLKIKVDPKGNVVLDGKVKVTKTDVDAGNGVIHVIDGVLMPKAEAAKPAGAKPAGAAPHKDGSGQGRGDGSGGGKDNGGGGGKGNGGGHGHGGGKGNGNGGGN